MLYLVVTECHIWKLEVTECHIWKSLNVIDCDRKIKKLIICTGLLAWLVNSEYNSISSCSFKSYFGVFPQDGFGQWIQILRLSRQLTLYV